MTDNAVRVRAECTRGSAGRRTLNFVSGPLLQDRKRSQRKADKLLRGRRALDTAAMGLPLLKLFFLAVKQVAKPVASRVKNFAVRSPTFSALMGRLGNGLYRNSVQIERIADGKEAMTTVAKLNQKRAVEEGSEFLAEVVVYSVSAVVLGVEYMVSKRKDEAKAAEVKRLEEANEELQWQEFAQLHKRVANLQSAVVELVAEREERERRSWWRRSASSSEGDIGRRLNELNPAWGR